MSNHQTVRVLQVIFTIAILTSCHSQENAQFQVSPSLAECYNTSEFENHDNRLPSNMETLIALIEKIENSYEFDQDIRQLTVSLLHRFRQDGIQRAQGIGNIPGVLPYSPTGLQFDKFRILLSRLIPGNALRFPNDTLTREERCALHFMLSSSFEKRVRGDESQVCNSFAQYRAQRLIRELNPERGYFSKDVELLNTNKQNPDRFAYKNRRLRTDNEFNWANFDLGGTSSSSSSSGRANGVSQCPVENGVVRTHWGTVAAGSLIAGIAAGLQPQTVQLKTLLALSKRRPQPSGGIGSSIQNTLAQISTIVNVDNRWAATLAGDLAEVTLMQIPLLNTNNDVSIGASGVWNNSVLPKWYFLNQNEYLEMTDAEIRGGLDGLIIAMNIENWRQLVPNLKLSQLLRMYYSLQGVLNTDVKACNRKNNFAIYASPNVLMAQTSALGQVLDREILLSVSLQPETIENFTNYAVDALMSYVSGSMHDVSCSVSNALSQNTNSFVNIVTDIYIYLDTTWPYNEAVKTISYILNNLNVNPYGSSVTILSSGNGAILVNTTNYLNDVFLYLNASTYSTVASGFNLPMILQTLQNHVEFKMEQEKNRNSISSGSLIGLLMPRSATINEADANYAKNQLTAMKEQIPDLNIIYLAYSIDGFSEFVEDTGQNLFGLIPGEDIAKSADPVLKRIKQIPQRLINPRCGCAWHTDSWGNDQIAQYLRPGSIKFYRMASNYFYGRSKDGRHLKIQPSNYMKFTVCSSRTEVLPQQNTSFSQSGQQTCTNIQKEAFSYDMSNMCADYSTIHKCPPLYISIQASSSIEERPEMISCAEASCQTPDETRYTISVINLSCYSSAETLIIYNFASLIGIYLIHLLII